MVGATSPSGTSSGVSLTAITNLNKTELNSILGKITLAKIAPSVSNKPFDLTATKNENEPRINWSNLKSFGAP